MKYENIKLIKSTGKMGEQFVGLKIINDKIEFYYPATYNLSHKKENLRKDILSILKTVSLVKNQTDEQSFYKSEYKNDYKIPLESLMWIINDYITNGKYDNREIIYKKSFNGKINWKKTLQSIPLISNKNIIYTDIISQKQNQKDNLLTEIYNYCVYDAVRKIGWLFNASVDFDISGCDSLFNKNLYLNAINTEITHTFNDTKKLRLQQMKNIILGLDENSVNFDEFIYGVDSYETVFEKMIDLMFSNVSNIRQFYPNAVWKLVLENNAVKSTNLRPDTVIIKNKKVYILDSKYYKYGVTFNHCDMPETASIQKQITYGEYVKKVKENQYDDIYSAFILPYSKTENKYNDRFNKNIEFIGIGEAKWIDYVNENENSRKIVALLIDMNFLVENYLRQSDEYINEITALIEKSTEELNNE